jgi:hypothetical protein
MRNGNDDAFYIRAAAAAAAAVEIQKTRHTTMKDEALTRIIEKTKTKKKRTCTAQHSRENRNRRNTLKCVHCVTLMSADACQCDRRQKGNPKESSADRLETPTPSTTRKRSIQQQNTLTIPRPFHIVHRIYDIL